MPLSDLQIGAGAGLSSAVESFGRNLLASKLSRIKDERERQRVADLFAGRMDILQEEDVLTRTRTREAEEAALARPGKIRESTIAEILEGGGTPEDVTALLQSQGLREKPDQPFSVNRPVSELSPEVIEQFSAGGFFPFSTGLTAEERARSLAGEQLDEDIKRLSVLYTTDSFGNPILRPGFEEDANALLLKILQKPAGTGLPPVEEQVVEEPEAVAGPTGFHGEGAAVAPLDPLRAGLAKLPAATFDVGKGVFSEILRSMGIDRTDIEITKPEAKFNEQDEKDYKSWLETNGLDSSTENRSFFKKNVIDAGL